MRQGQPDFRNKLIFAYSGRCAVTGCDAVYALEAAHIVAYTGPESDHVQNGLLLRADIHTLFDLDLIGIDPDTLNISIAPAISDTVYAELCHTPLRKPTDTSESPSRESLVIRWRQFCGERAGVK